MQVKSFHTTEMDLFDAGILIGAYFRELSPEIIFLFLSVDYEPFNDLISGIYSELDIEKTLLFGGTGDGFYETEGIGSHGIAAMGINSDGMISWDIEYASGLSEDSYRSGQVVAQKLVNKQKKYTLGIVLSDGIKGDGVSLLEGLNEHLTIPFYGATTGDNRSFKRGYVIVNQKIYRNTVAVLGISGAVMFTGGAHSGWLPIGDTKPVTSVSGNRVFTIGTQPALDFFKAQIGNQLKLIKEAWFPLAVYQPDGSFLIRAPISIDEGEGSVLLAGAVKEGEYIRISHSNISNIINGVDQCLDTIMPLKFDPECALVFSCIVRKWVLMDHVAKEKEHLFQRLNKRVPMVGFPCFGEVAPMKQVGQSDINQFHNETYVVCLLGSGEDIYAG